MDTAGIVITVVVLGAIAWLAFLVASSIRGRGKEEVPPNLAPGITDDTLESKRLDKTLASAVVLSGVLALSLPIYFLSEQGRQDGFVEEFDHAALERGAELYQEFQCGNCHGVDGGGGVAAYVEKRSGISVAWKAPAINTVLYQYTPEETRYWIVYGRANSPMPAWGLAGGGPMNDQQVDELMEYLQSEEFELSQDEALLQIEPAVAAELSRLETASLATRQSVSIAATSGTFTLTVDGETTAPLAFDTGAADLETALSSLASVSQVTVTGAGTGEEPWVVEFPDAPSGVAPLVTADGAALGEDGTVSVSLREGAMQTAIRDQQTLIAGILAAPSRVAGIEALRARASDLLESAAEGIDVDGDGLSDRTEEELTAIFAEAAQAAGDPALGAPLDPQNAETSPGEADLELARRSVTALGTLATNLRVTTDNQEKLLTQARDGLAFLERAAAEQNWVIDIEGVAGATFQGDSARAGRAVGLFNAYCARCHTAGYSAGVPLTQAAGSGALGPALWNGRPRVQFLTADEMVQFILKGSENGVPYGVNGVGSGRMPGFGSVLSLEDLQLIVDYLRGDTLTGE